jgi:hypothetical protein
MRSFVTLFENEYTIRSSHEINQHEQKFEKLIEKSKLFIFYLSQNFQDDKTCMDQLCYAIKLNKKVFYLTSNNNHNRLNSSVDLSKCLRLEFKQENQQHIKKYMHVSFLRYFENYIHVDILRFCLNICFKEIYFNLFGFLSHFYFWVVLSKLKKKHSNFHYFANF